MSKLRKITNFHATVSIEVAYPRALDRLEQTIEAISSIFARLLGEKKLKGLEHCSGDISQYFLNLCIVGEERIRTLNKDYRQRDKVTDVLSFPVHDDLRKSVDKNVVSLGEVLLGDIFVCIEVAERQASESNIDLITEISELYIHGVLHLLGFDHEISENEKNLMYQLEEEIFNQYRKIQ